MENPVVIFGAKGLGKVALDIFKQNGVMVYGFLDDDAKLHGQEIQEVPVLGSTDNEEVLKVLAASCEAFLATDDNRERKALAKMLVEGYKKMPVNAIHPSAIIEASASLGHGNLLAAGSYLGSFATLGNHCILNARAVVDYDAQLGHFVQVGAGSTIGPGAVVAEGAFIGSGATVVAGIRVGKNARVGAGSLVIADVPDNTTVFGVPAQKVAK
jgi:sugar O-acyltransferase (sialic acid O-acetyltransferase NeuD family)